MASEAPRPLLQEDELRELEATLLPTLERHHLRLLAHGLRTLQAIASRTEGSPPADPEVEAWVGSHPLMEADPGFAGAFLPQLKALRAQLEVIAAQRGGEAMGLEIADLIAWARQQADLRLAAPALSSMATAGEPPAG